MFARLGVGLIAVLVLLLAGFLVLGYVFMKRSVPDLSGSRQVRGISSRVTIERDSFGVPTISASTESEAYFGLGYAEAQDRLFQMETMRRLGEGRLSELLGEKGLILDVWARTIGFSRIANELWTHSSARTKVFLNSFVGGINAYIADHKTRPGFEFDALKAQPEPWTPEQCLIIGRLLSWELNFSYWTDAAFGDIASSIDSAHLVSIFPDYPANGTTVLEGATEEVRTARWNGPELNVHPKAAIAIPKSLANPEVHVPAPQKPMPTRSSGSQPPAKAHTKPVPRITPKLPVKLPPHAPIRHGANADDSNTLRNLYAGLREINRDLAALLGPFNAGGGSNAFAIAPTRTSTGGAILENDTHLRLGAPARWYLAHLKSDDGLNVAGFSIPGLPLFICGRNKDISWGITSGMADETDFFVESLDSSGAKYLTPSGPKPFVEFTDSIRIRDTIASKSLRTVTLEIRQTIHGPVIEQHPFTIAKQFRSSEPENGVPQEKNLMQKKGPISLAWNGEYALTDELAAFFNLHRARSIHEARIAMRSFATPVLNMCFAEARSGAIGYAYVGRLPKRTGSEDRLLLPRDGASAADEWQGFTTLEDQTAVENPQRGYIVSANNPPMRPRTIPISDNWETSARADRITQLIEQSTKFDAIVAGHLSLDITSPLDRDIILPRLLAVYPDPNPLTTKPDSSSVLRLDSIRRSWRLDSLRRHAAPADSAAQKQLREESERVAALTPSTSNASRVDPQTALALEYLRNWEGDMSTDEAAPAIYAVFLKLLIENTFRDELGPERFNEFSYVSNIPLQSLERILGDPKNVWWDDVTTSGPIRENRDSILKLTLSETLRVLAASFGKDIRTWQWGKLHTLTYHHQFESAGEAIARLVNIESGPAAGGLTSVSQAGYDLWQPFDMKVGPSMRMVADMKSDVLLAALPTGNSEAFFGPHYKDMLDMFKKGRFDELHLDGGPGAQTQFELLPIK